MLQDLHSYLTPQRQASIYATGLLTILTLGTLACIVVALLAIWLVAQLATLIFSSIVESLETASGLFASSPELVKILALVVIGVVCYRAARKVWRS